MFERACALRTDRVTFRLFFWQMAIIIIVSLALAACQRQTKTFHEGLPTVDVQVTYPPAPETRRISQLASPTPRCWIYDKIYPATETAYKEQHVTAAERKEIQKWAAPVSPSEQQDRTGIRQRCLADGGI